MIKVDKQGIPTIVQWWNYGGVSNFEVRLFTNKYLNIDMWEARDHSLKGYTKWTEDMDELAITKFIEDFCFEFKKSKKDSQNSEG